MNRTIFVIDSIPNETFTGFTDGDDWNSWACPFFEKSEAERVLKASEANGFEWEYDIEQDAYIVSNS